MNTDFSDRRTSVRMPTEIQGRIEEESCYISNLSDGGAMLLSAFKEEFFEKKGVIRATNSVAVARTANYKNSFMYALSVAFTEVVTDKDFFSLDG